MPPHKRNRHLLISLADKFLVELTGFRGAQGFLTKTRGTQIKVEKFEVFEVPKFFPTGEGEHTWALIEKVNRSTIPVIRDIADFGNVSMRDVGYCGLKDKNAKTTQWVSSISEIPREGRDFRSIVQVKSRKKLKVGNLHGNWFKLRIDAESPQLMLKTLSELKKIPNFFGPQRFSRDNEKIGELLIRKQKEEAVSLMKMRRIPLTRKYFRLMEDAFTSLLFNEILSIRINKPNIEGDINSWSGPTGPLFGKESKLAESEAGKIEQKILDKYNLTLRDFPGKGRRRPLFTLIKGLSYKQNKTPTGGKIELKFFLPKGVYATTVLREIVKN